MFENVKSRVSAFVHNPVVKTLAVEAAVIATVAVVSWGIYYAVNGAEATEEAWKKATHQTTEEEPAVETIE